MATQIFDLNKVTLIYKDESGQTHEQPLGDLVEVGTLIDPDTGDDMPVIGAVVED
jgi:hypothetical protein